MVTNLKRIIVALVLISISISLQSQISVKYYVIDRCDNSIKPLEIEVTNNEGITFLATDNSYCVMIPK